ncbi:MAG: hypothetical protein KTR31_24030 [Myxococcales bacterium]|nr:hypothetical protein [Myxococcales bacterium]
MSAAPYALVHVLILSTLLGVAHGGAAWGVTPLLVFGVVPLADRWVPERARRLDEAQRARRARNPWFRRVLRAWVPLYGLTVAACLWRVAAGVSPLDAVGMVLALGITTGIGGMSVARELEAGGHRAMAELLALCAGAVSGSTGAASQPVPVQTRSTLYGYVPRAVAGRVRRALVRHGQRRRARGGLVGAASDPRVRYPVGLALMGLVAWAVAGPWGLGIWAAQLAVAAALVESLHYVSHYGRVRFSGPQRVSGWLLLHPPVQGEVRRPYWLRGVPAGAPRLPFGGPAAVLVALVPPVWFRVMGPHIRIGQHA